MRERYAAALPDADRTRGLAAVDALLGESLRLDGGRYATPYNFVRALRRRRVLLPPASAADAVQLLTIHGAKGLEARAVFVVDSQGEAPRAQSATLLIDWPADAPHPRRCAFIASEARCPPSLRVLRDEERAGRAREELNALYVAMTRARERLLFSATVPYGALPGPSAWQRLADAGAPRRDPPPAAPTAAAQAATITLRALPPLPTDALPRPASTLPADAAAGEAARLGRAVHRVLERLADAAAPVLDGLAPASRPPNSTVAPPAPPRGRPAPAAQLGLFDEGQPPAVAGPPSEERTAVATAPAPESHAPGLPAPESAALDAEAARAAAEFGLPPEAGGRVAALAGAVLRSPACGRFFDRQRLLWAGNEVPLAWRGATLRIDRLVALRGADGAREWWVLDYKLQHVPQQVEAYRGQLAGYREAVQRLQPGETVRAAFVTGAGEIVPL